MGNRTACLIPTEMNTVGDEHVVAAVVAGNNHTLLLCDDGVVLSCGTAELGQLGREVPQEDRRVVKVKAVNYEDDDEDEGGGSEEDGEERPAPTVDDLHSLEELQVRCTHTLQLGVG